MFAGGKGSWRIPHLASPGMVLNVSTPVYRSRRHFDVDGLRRHLLLYSRTAPIAHLLSRQNRGANLRAYRASRHYIVCLAPRISVLSGIAGGVKLWCNSNSTTELFVLALAGGIGCI